MIELGIEYRNPPGYAASGLEAMRALCDGAGLVSVDACVISIQTHYADFDDFWESNTVPIGPVGVTLAAMSTDTRETLKACVRKNLPTDATGRISVEARANAVKGIVPNDFQ